MSGTTSVLVSELPKAGRKENDESLEAMKDMIRQFAALVAQVEFDAAAPATGDAAGDAVRLDLLAEDANDVRILFAEQRIKRVRLVYDAASTATGVTIKNSKGESITAELEKIDAWFEKGLAWVTVEATGAGTVVLTLEDVDSAGVVVTDTHTVTFS